MTIKPLSRSRTRIPKRTHSSKSSSLLTVLVWVSIVYFLVPIIWLAIASTKDNSDLFSTFGLWFGNGFHLFTNISQVFSLNDGIFSRWLLNTVLYAVVSAVGAAALATACGYALAKYRFRGQTAVFWVIIGAVMVPMTALAIPTYLLFSSVSLTDTVWAVILPGLVSPFGVYLMRVYAAESVDNSLMEAARIDGAGELRIFMTIGLRLLTPGIVTVLLFQLVATWNNYFLPLIMLNSPSLYPVTVGLAQWQLSASSGGGAQVLFSTVLTGSLVSVLPLVVSFLFLQRFWQSGLSAGGVKG
ncbi:carbohydrate ABC transporter membrane protein 2, CUT1 family [Agreia bicolorata]|uniref:Carbohydrate ABC transporter membrane protein 2, CUT1 family n=1 Tax=Agreia bicolorata TaxID=110935 RepID=A0A1T4Y270_9MICO|nr:carbohydrate ABC transporter permease [Agreia bicolorata]KJC64634.1 sugar ABC transporter permease [Agreia bicolorata]SKA95927.1 carbohydrate ABC transporter membrane protein 2, CUT1 family [Agreia bicolorata]